MDAGTDITTPKIPFRLSIDDVMKLQALTMLGGTIAPGADMREWCKAFWLRLLPIRLEGVSTLPTDGNGASEKNDIS